MNAFTDNELEQYYESYMIANTPSFLFNSWLSLLSNRPDINTINKEFINGLFDRSENYPDPIFIRRLGLCCCSFVSEEAFADFKDESHDDPWWQNLIALIDYRLRGKFQPNLIIEPFAAPVNIYQKSSPTKIITL